MNLKLATLALIGLTTLTLTGCTGDKQTVTIDETQTVESAAINSIDIETSSTEVYVKPSSGDQIEIALQGTVEGSGSEAELKERFPLVVNTNGDDLSVSVLGKKTLFSEGKTTLRLDIAVPGKLYDEFSLTGSSADVELEDVQAESLILESSSGNISLKGYQGDQLTVKTSSGNAELALVSVKDQVNIETNSGDAKLALPAGADFDLDFSANSGDKKINYSGLNLTVDEENKAAGTAGSGGAKITVRSTSGDFELNEK